MLKNIVNFIYGLIDDKHSLICKTCINYHPENVKLAGHGSCFILSPEIDLGIAGAISEKNRIIFINDGKKNVIIYALVGENYGCIHHKTISQKKENLIKKITDNSDDPDIMRFLNHDSCDQNTQEDMFSKFEPNKDFIDFDKICLSCKLFDPEYRFTETALIKDGIKEYCYTPCFNGSCSYHKKTQSEYYIKSEDFNTNIKPVCTGCSHFDPTSFYQKEWDTTQAFIFYIPLCERYFCPNHKVQKVKR